LTTVGGPQASANKYFVVQVCELLYQTIWTPPPVIHYRLWSDPCILESFLLLVVHVTGLQTRAGMRVWVGQVRVRVQCEVPVRNPYLTEFQIAINQRLIIVR
jgi:hypothetical protein